MDWDKEVKEHKIFTNALELYICQCLDNKIKSEVIKKSLSNFVDKEVEKLKRIRRGIKK